jgi:hypothetical protein
MHPAFCHAYFVCNTMEAIVDTWARMDEIQNTMVKKHQLK